MKRHMSVNGISMVMDAANIFHCNGGTASIIGKQGGIIMNIGLGIDQTGLPVNHLIRFEIEIKGSFCYSEQDFVDALQLLTDGKVSEKGWSNPTIERRTGLFC